MKSKSFHILTTENFICVFLIIAVVTIMPSILDVAVPEVASATGVGVGHLKTPLSTPRLRVLRDVLVLAIHVILVIVPKVVPR